jgi:outer membrane protein assembly factor BamB
MSVADTNYTIIVKGKPLEARQAAADYITLLLNVWKPERLDMKTQIKIAVFRNEMHSRGFMEPVDLAKHASEFLPGIQITVQGKSESGDIHEDFRSNGVVPEYPFDLTVEKALAKLTGVVESTSFRHEWIKPMMSWAGVAAISKNSIKKINDQFKITEKAFNKAVIQKKREEDKARKESLLKANEAEKLNIESLNLLRWIYNPISSFKATKLGLLGNPYLAKKDNRPGGGYFINIPITLTNNLKPEIIINSFFKKEEIVLSIKNLGSIQFLFNLNNFEISEEKTSPEISFHVHNIEEFNFQEGSYFHKLINGSELLCYEGISCEELLKDTPEVSNLVVSDEKGVFFTVILPDGIHLHGINENGKLFFNTPTGITFTDAMCMDEDRIYISGQTGSERENPCCIKAISRAESPGWRIDLPIKSDRPWDEKKDYCKNIAVAPNLLVYCLNNQAWNQSLLDCRNLVALDPRTGLRLWDTEINQHPSALIMDGSQIYVSDSTHIHAFDYEGTLFWSVRLPDISIDPGKHSFPVMGLALDGHGHILVTLKEKGIASLGCNDGRTLWILSVNGVMSSCVIGSDGVCYFTSAQNKATKIHAIDSKKGIQIWEFEVPEEPWIKLGPSPTITSNGVILTTETKIIHLDSKTGLEVCVLGNQINLHDGYGYLNRAIPENNFLLLSHRSTNFPHPYRLPNSLAAFNGDFGKLAGPWPISGGNKSNSNYLETKNKSGFKEFIADWRQGKPVAHRLAKFNIDFKDELLISSQVHGVIRGRELIKNSQEWAEPKIGSGPSAKYRGLQWKLVMAYSGMELLIKSLFAIERRGIRPDDLKDLISKLLLPDFGPIASPSLERKSIKEWIEELDRDAVLDFLKTDNGDRAQLQSWILEQKSCATWRDAILLSKALRNCTAHGALSPSKIEQWGLADAFRQLPSALFMINEAIFEVLGE